MAAGLMTFSCNSNKDRSDAPESIALNVSGESLVDSEGSFCPSFTRDSNGNTVLSRILQKGKDEYILAYSVSTDGGKTFGEVIEIPGSTGIHPHEENLPKVIFKPSGEVIAVWPEANPNENNQYSDIVFYSTSSDSGKSWTSPSRLVSPDKSYDQRYFDLVVLPDREIGISWLDERKINEKEGSGLYFAQTTGGLTFENEKVISGPACECCRTKLLLDSKDNLHVLYRGIIQDSIRDMMHQVSTDGGKTFDVAKRISEDNWTIYACPHTGPSMTETSEGLQFTWFTGGVNGGIYYNSSNDSCKSFTDREKVSNGITVMHSQMEGMGDRSAIVWDENLSNHHQSASAIGVEIRDVNGNAAYKDYITSETGEAGFPIIQKLDNQTAMVAYTVRENERDFVKYKIIRLETNPA